MHRTIRNGRHADAGQLSRAAELPLSDALSRVMCAMSARIHVDGRYTGLRLQRSWHFPSLAYPSSEPLRQVAAREGQSWPAAADAFAALERKRLITRSHPVEVQKPVVISLTPRGREVLKQLLSRLHELHEEEARLFSGPGGNDLVYSPTTIEGELDAGRPASRFVCPLCQSALGQRFRET